VHKELYHCTTPKKFARYVASRAILPPVRGFSTESAAREWCKKTGRTIILRIIGSAHPLPDHKQRSGTAWWIKEPVAHWETVWTKPAEEALT